MKNTIRASHKRDNKSASAQPEKPSIHGQNDATIGQIKSRVKGKITIGALRVGEALGMNEGQINALSYVSAQVGISPDEYCKSVIISQMQAKYEPNQGRSALWDASTKLEHVNHEVKALLGLIVAYLENPVTGLDCYGFSRLARSVEENLGEAFDGVHSASRLIFPPIRHGK